MQPDDQQAASGTRPPVRIAGECDARFAAIRAVFEANFTHRNEVGAAVCVYAGGQKVVDLWGGMADPDAGVPWMQDTLVCMMSLGKGMAAICVHQLIEGGRIDLQAPVARYWPEFAQAGKDKTTIAHLLGGQSGALFADSAPPNSVMQWDVMVRAIAAQEPAWRPGSRGADHSMTFGFLMGELVRRVDGRRLDSYFRQEIAEPLGAEYGWGLSDAQIARVAPIIADDEHTLMRACADRGTPLGRAWQMRPAGAGFCNTEAFRKGVLPSSNGHGTARGVARIYAALANHGAVGGLRILQPGSVERLRELQWDGPCAMTDRHYRYGLGMFLNTPPLGAMGPNPRAFGHPGTGGALGFADPEAGLAFAYSPNALRADAGAGERCAALVDALYSVRKAA